MARIYLSGKRGKGKYALVDSEDFALYGHMKWHLSDTGYALRRVKVNGKNVTYRLHRLIAGADSDEIVDHINRDRLDNRRSNLRIVDFVTNVRNSDRIEYSKGYWYHKKNNNWVVEVYGIHRGTFEDEKEAAEFAELVRTGKADMKPKAVRTHCSRGHSLDDAYIVAGYKICKPCQKRRSAEYFQRKKGKGLWQVSQTING